MRRSWICLVMLVWACDSDDADEMSVDAGVEADVSSTDGPPALIEIAGTYLDNFGGAHAISLDGWQQGEGAMASDFALLHVDNEANFAIAKNGANNMFSPDLYSRFDWTEVDAQRWFCQTAFDAETQADALAVAAADPSDPATTGCGGFGWSQLNPPLDITGDYTEGEGTHAVSQTQWIQTYPMSEPLVFDIKAFNNDARWIVAQNAVGNAFNPELWSRFEWVEDGSNLYYCQSAFDAATQADAMAAVSADADDLEGGCGTFPWSPLISE